MLECKITVLVNDTTSTRNLMAEHGLALWIETDTQKILFDTGQGRALKTNANCLGVNLASADAVVLSHGHYDHTGGLGELLQRSANIQVYAHRHVLSPKFVCTRPGHSRAIGMPDQVKQTFSEHVNISWVEEPTEIAEGVYLTGPIPRDNDFEDTGGSFFKDADCKKPDDMLDDQAAFLETGHGLVVLLGCGHAGIINTLNYIRCLIGETKIYAVIGGLHLLNASQYRLQQTVSALRSFSIPSLIPCHCTGSHASKYLQETLGKQVVPGHSGWVFPF